jgi:hypothetical protein
MKACPDVSLYPYPFSLFSKTGLPCSFFSFALVKSLISSANHIISSANHVISSGDYVINSDD